MGFLFRCVCGCVGVCTFFISNYELKKNCNPQHQKNIVIFEFNFQFEPRCSISIDHYNGPQQIINPSHFLPNFSYRCTCQHLFSSNGPFNYVWTLHQARKLNNQPLLQKLTYNKEEYVVHHCILFFWVSCQHMIHLRHWRLVL